MLTDEQERQVLDHLNAIRKIIRRKKTDDEEREQIAELIVKTGAFQQKGITKEELKEFREKVIESVSGIEPETVLRRVTAPSEDL